MRYLFFDVIQRHIHAMKQISRVSNMFSPNGEHRLSRNDARQPFPKVEFVSYALYAWNSTRVIAFRRGWFLCFLCS